MVRRNNAHRLHIELLESRRLLSVYADFNGDGRDDLAIGVPDEDNGSGVVHVLYGSSGGLTATGNQLWSQDTSVGFFDVPDVAEPGDHFGAALAGGDFNHDGFADLAIGVPGEDFGATSNAGAVNILYGSASGLDIDIKNNKLWHQDASRVREINETDDAFGSALAAGDFNHDGFTDLAVGAPGDDVGSLDAAGYVHIFYGGGIGINPPGNQTFNLESPGVPGVATNDDLFGAALVAGDFNGDNRDDLAIGVPHFNPSGVEGAGAVCILYASPNGLVTSGSQLWNQDISGIAGVAEEFDAFGFAVAAGDFNNDNRDDLAIGVPGEDIGVGGGEGFVHVLYGSASGITATGSQAFDQGDVGGLPSSVEEFGFAVTAADFNGDNRDDLAIGTPLENKFFGVDEGIVHVVFGGTGSLNLATAIKIEQEDLGISEESEATDRFGTTLGAGDFNGDGKADLVIGAPDEDVGEDVAAGAVYVLHGGAPFSGGEGWNQDSAGIAGTAEPFDHFGGGLDAGGGKSAPGGNRGRQDIEQLISADFEFDPLLAKLNKRRFLSGRR